MWESERGSFSTTVRASRNFPYLLTFTQLSWRDRTNGSSCARGVQGADTLLYRKLTLPAPFSLHMFLLRAVKGMIRWESSNFRPNVELVCYCLKGVTDLDLSLAYHQFQQS